MPCLTSERYRIDSVEKLRKNMCSTPLHSVTAGLPENDVDFLEFFNISGVSRLDETEDHDKDAAAPAPIDESYYKILWELERINKIKREREHCLQRSITLLRDNDSMLDKWENLECKTDEVERRCFLQRDILELRKKLQDVSIKMPNMAFQIEDRLQLEKNIQILKVELDLLEDKKSLISDYNIKAHRLLNDSKYSTVSLKDDINELYHVWEETHQKVSHQLQTLQQALLAWRNFDMHMLELKTVLREDHTALNVLDKALKHEEYVGNVASTVQNIAKYLPDKHHENLIKADSIRMTSLDTEHVDSMSTLLTNTLNVEASFSDSGISDSGSEQDLCEREKRLALLRKLARHLEAVLAPGSEALLSIMKKIDEAEEEIRELQQTCRIIIKTGYMERNEREFFKKEKLFRDDFQKTNKIERRSSPGDPGSDPDKGRSIFWRVLRAALPFHLAIVVLLCVACLLEPNCCDAINNLNLSLSPQLRYLSGPPPT